MKEEEMTNMFRVDIDIQSEKAIDFAFKSLKNEWNYNDKFIMAVAKHFECATEGNIYLDILDGAEDIEEAWEVYCNERGLHFEPNNNPFNNEQL